MPERSGDRVGKEAPLLVVDDHELLLRTLVRALGDEFDIVTARDATEALRQISDIRLSGALVDYDLPDLKGTAILQYLQEHEPSALRMLMSGRSVPCLDEYRSSGLVQYFWSKPFDIEQVRRYLRSR